MNITTCTIDGLLVEFLAKEENQGFSHLDEFWGPYPSGVPTIFTDQVAKLGSGSVLFNYVDNDVFGKMSVAHLEKDGVNVNGIAMLQKATIDNAFVNYCSQAQRDFIFNMPNSTCGLLTADHIDKALLSRCQHLHITGSSLSSFRIIDAMHKAIENIKGRNDTVSFDPNIRKEMLNISEMSQAFEYILSYADTFLPSDGELDYFGLNPERNEQTPVDNLLKHDVEHVVIKREPRGTNYFNTNETHHVADFSVPMVDPTGTEGCFGTTSVSLFLSGTTPQEALRWANASDSLAISQRGPVEGTSAQAQIRTLLATQHP